MRAAPKPIMTQAQRRSKFKGELSKGFLRFSICIIQANPDVPPRLEAAAEISTIKIQPSSWKLPSQKLGCSCGAWV